MSDSSVRPHLVTSGIADYPWPRFILWVVLGQALEVVLYVMLGYVFSDRVQAIVEVLSNFAWVVLGRIVASILGWKMTQDLAPRGAFYRQRWR